MRMWPTCLGTVVLCVGLSQAASAKEPSKTTTQDRPAEVCGLVLKTPYMTWAKLPVNIYVKEGLPETFVNATKEAIAKWNAITGQEMLAFKGPSKACKKISVNCILLEKREIGDTPKPEREEYAYAKQDFTGNHWSGTDIFLNDNIKWAHPSKVGEVDPFEVILHELGHVLGLQHHFFYLSSVMNYVPFESGSNRLEITAFDLSLLAWLYKNGPCPPDYFLAFVDGQYEIALSLLAKAFPDVSAVKDVNVLYLKSRSERFIGKLDESMSSIDRAIEVAQDQSGASSVLAYLYTHRADLYFRKLNYRSALKDFERALKLDSYNYQTMTYVAYLRYLMGKDKGDVVGILDKAIEIKPNFAMAKDLRSKVLSSADSDSKTGP